jgi:cyclohexanecarboxyl-CoA dehydrogenase
MGTNQFGFTEEQEMFRQTIRRFAQKELAPTAWQREQPDCDPAIKEEVMNKVKEQGWLKVNYPEKYGGWHLDWVDLGIISEELFKVDITTGIWPWFSTFNGYQLNEATQEVQDELIPKLMNLHAFIGRGYTEAQSGNEFVTIKCKAERHGDHYIVNGEKQPASMVMFSSHIIFSCKTNTKVPAHEGMSMFVIPKNLPGISCSSLPYCLGPMGMSPKHPVFGGGNAIITFDDCKVPAKYLLGKEGDGYRQQEEGYNIARLYGIIMGALGWAEQSLEFTMNYVKERRHFGRPIVQFEGVSFKIAEHYTALEAARFLAYQAMWLKDQGRPNMKETAMAKLFGVEAARACIHDCLMICGYTAFSLEHWMQDRMRGVIGLGITDGAEQIQKLHILRELMGPEALPKDMHDKF